MGELKPCVMCDGEHRKLMGYDIHKASCKDENCPMSYLVLTPEQWNTRASENQLTTITKQRDELLELLSMVNERSSVTPNLFGGYFGVNIPNAEVRRIRHVLSTIKEQKDEK